MIKYIKKLAGTCLCLHVHIVDFRAYVGQKPRPIWPIIDCVTPRHHISSNKNSRRWILFFSPPIGGDYSRDAIISNIAHWKSCTKIFCFIIPLNSKKIIISNKLNMGFLSVPNLIHWLIFNVNNLGIRDWIITDQLCWIKERRGVGGGDYSREGIILSISVKERWLFKGGG